MKAKLPKTLLIYVAYEHDGQPYYVATTDKLEDLPEEAAGEEVGYYALVEKGKLRVTKELA